MINFMKFFEKIFMKELFNYLLENKKYWLIPVITILLLIGFLVVYAGSSALSPFIYSLF